MGDLIEFPTGRKMTGSAEPTTAEDIQTDLVTLIARAATACLDALAATSPDDPHPRHPSQGPPA